MLSDNIITHAGGGGKAGKAVEITVGSNAVAQLLVRSYERYLNKLDIAFKDVNNSPAALFYKGGKLVGCQVFDINPHTDAITNIYFIAGRKKLQGLQNDGFRGT
ncbi:hypothetical protein A4R26_29230 [Niastella populi]|uniref:Uncharacterized protein n=2 Tax=Niastella populi TaxID=550983 RepID=A0A1V9F0J4_9BACT|nr:hypothetical protein A4R26_29230 [Niastella populi]